MNAEQKNRALGLIDVTKTYRLDAEECAMQMAALLQELVDAPEPEPAARVTGYYAGYLSIATVDGRVLPAGTALYAAPPAPSVPDVANTFKRRAEEIVAMAVNREDYAKINRKVADLVTDIANAAEATTQAEPPADLVQDSVASEPVGYLYTNLQSGEYHVSDADDDYRGPERALWCIEPVYRRAKGQS